MIHEVSGDILLSKAQVLVHGVAPNDNFHSGLALALRERWPAMYNDFRHHCKQNHPEAGGLWFWGGPGVQIINLLTQESAYGHGSKPGRATVANVNHCLRALRKTIEKEGYESIALPKLATGVGGLDWAEVKPLIQNHLGDLEIPIYIYTTYVAGEQAAE